MVTKTKPTNKPLTESRMVELLADFYDDFLEPKFSQLHNENSELKVGQRQLQNDIEKLQADMTFVKRDIGEIKEDLSTTASLSDLRKLEYKMEKRHKVN